MKIKFIHPVPGMAYFAGDIAEIDEQRGAKLIAQGSAFMIPETEGTPNNLPQDIPAREILFENGLENMVDVKNALETLTDLNGIGKATAKKIIAFVKEYNEHL